MADEPVTPVGDAAAVLPVTEAAETAGMPQLDFSTFPNQIFWLVVALVSIYFILDRVALPRVASVLSERQGQITGDLAAAEDLKAEAEEAEANYEQALKDARAEAQDIVAAAKAEIQGELDESIAEAEAEISERTAEGEAEIAAIRESARQSVAEVARDTAAALVSALGVEADRAEIDAAVDRRLEGRA